MSSPAPLAVGLNLVYLVADSGGSGRYARELIRGLLAVSPETRITAFVGRTAPSDLFEASWSSAVDWVRLPVSATARVPWHLAGQMIGIPAIAAKRRLDVVHGLANLVPVVSPLVPTVVTLLDVTWIHYPTTMARRATLGMKVLAPLCARSADRVIAISEAAKHDIVATIGLDERKIDVTPLGIRLETTAVPVPEEDIRRRFGLGEGPVILTVAQKREHKNLATLIRAAAAIPGDDVHVVLPGSPTPYEVQLKRLAEQLGIGDRTHFPEWISEAELEGLYRTAACFALPSFMEGFGLPVLEAMRRGVPVVCSNASSLPEVAGDAALLVDPHRSDELAAAITRLLSNPADAATLVERGYERCRLFTWEKTVRATLAVYRRAIEQRRESRLRRLRARARSSGPSAPPSPPS
jgi:glycosyltransferase involved in cell wall biosynthesis